MTAVLERSGVAVGDASVGVLKAKALWTAVSDALNFAASPAALVPILESVRIESDGTSLVAVATDRFTLGVSRVDCSGGPFAVTVSAEDARNLVRMARTGKSAQGWREVTVSASDRGAEFRFSSGESMAVRGRAEEFPRWRQLIPGDDKAMGAGVGVGVGFDPVLLAKFGKVRAEERGRRMVLLPTMPHPGRPGPAVVQIGPDFISVIMPVRAPGGTEIYDPPAWLYR